MKLASEDEKRPVPVFVARRMAWYPPTPLGNLGFDQGLLDTVENKGGLGEEDREPFYQMLAAAGRAGPRQLIDEANQELKQLAHKAEETTDTAEKKRLDDLIRTDRDDRDALLRAAAVQRTGRAARASGGALRRRPPRRGDPRRRSRHPRGSASSATTRFRSSPTTRKAIP